MSPITANREWVVYALTDPRTDSVRYVGRTVNLAVRLRDHLKPSRLAGQQRRDKWLRQLVQAGLKPIVSVLERGRGDWAAAERRWISHFRVAGVDLTNLTDGGEGTLGFSHSDSSRAQMSEKRKGRPLSPQTIQAFVRKYTGVPRPAEVVEKIRAGLTGVPKSPSHRLALSAARTGTKASAETRAKLSAQRKGRAPWNKGLRMRAAAVAL